MWWLRAVQTLYVQQPCAIYGRQTVSEHDSILKDAALKDAAFYFLKREFSDGWSSSLFGPSIWCSRRWFGPVLRI